MPKCRDFLQITFTPKGSYILGHSGTKQSEERAHFRKQISKKFTKCYHLLLRAVGAVERRQHGRNAAQLPDTVPGESDVSPLAIQRRLALGFRRLSTRQHHGNKKKGSEKTQELM